MIISITTYKRDLMEKGEIPRKPISGANILMGCAQIIIALALGIILLEGYFHLAGVGEQEFVQPDTKMGCRHIPGKRVIWRLEGYSADKLSSVGLRDSEHLITKPSGTFRIALLGDSAVESLQVRMEKTFGKVLENLLNAQLQTHKAKVEKFEVINFGCSSYSTGQEILQYEQEIDKYNPDAIVLLYNRGDSLENVVKAKDRKRAEARPYFYLDSFGQVKEDSSILLVNEGKLKPNSVKEFLRSNSAIYGVLCQADFSLSLNEPRYCKLKNWWQALLNLPSKLARKKELVSQPFYPDQSDMTVTQALINKLAQMTKARKQLFILTVFPNTVKYQALTDQAKQLKSLAAKNNFGYLDLTDSFLACKDPSSNFLQYHFSEKGHAVVAYDLFNIFCRDTNIFSAN